MKRKMIAVAVIFCMLMSMFPTMALAADEPSVTFKIVPDKVEALAGSADVEVTYTISVVPENGAGIGYTSFYLVPPEGMVLGEYEENWSLEYHPKYNPEGIFEDFRGYSETSKLFVMVGTTAERCLKEEAVLMTIKATVAKDKIGEFALDVNTLDIGDWTGSIAGKYPITQEFVPVVVSQPISGEQDITITAPEKYATPQDSIAEGSGYTGTINWVPAVSNGNFDADTAYTAKVTLTAKEFYKFAADTTVNVTGAKIQNLVKADEKVSFDAVFPATAAKAVTALKITTPPSKVAYVEGENFDTNGMVVEATLDDKFVESDYKDYVIVNGDNLQMDTTEVIIEAGDITVTQPITVSCNHNLTDVAAKKATCIETGWDAYKECSKCGQLFALDGTTELDAIPERAIDPTNHVGDTEVRDAKDATCGEAGYTGDTYCLSCGAKIKAGSVIPATGKHEASADWTTDADNHWNVCNVCGEKMNKETHNFAWVIDEEATEDVTGLKHEECTVCGETRNENTVIDKLDHVHVGIVHHEAVAATCITEGTVEYWSCSSPKCDGKYYADENCTNELAAIVTPVDVDNHVGDTEVRDAKEATCGEAGYTGDTYCLSCGAKIKAGSVIPATGKHEASADWTTDADNHWNVCNVCGEKMNKEAHNFAWVIDEEATEDVTGLKHEECTVCGETRNENTVIDKLDHVHVGIVHHEAVAATCITEGTVEYWTCASDKCVGKCYADAACANELATIVTPVDVDKHVGDTEVRDAKEAACGADGYTGDTYCKDCGVLIKAGSVIPATGKHTASADWTTDADNHWNVCNVCGEKMNEEAHSFAWVIDKEATEDVTGLKHEECTVCGETRNEGTVIDKLDHVHVGIVHHEVVAATCITEGAVEYWTCASDKCAGKYYADENCTNELATIVTPVDANNHVGDTEVRDAKEATCGADGYTGNTYCKDCGVLIKEGSVISATGKHDNSGDWFYDETNHWKECTVCGDVIDEAAHTLNWVVDIPATEEETGVQHQECACGYVTAEGTEVPVLPHVHDMVHHDAVAATCVDTGIAEYWTCSKDKCEGIYYANEEGSATLDTIETDIDVTNHVGDTEVRDVVEATCGAEGYTGDTYCLSCGEKIADGKTSAATGKHSFGEWVQTVAPTETAKGEKERVCSVCDYKETAEIPMLKPEKPSTGSGSGGGFSGSYNYPVKADSVDGATVSFSKENAVAGDKVIITVTPDSGKRVDEVIVTDSNKKVIAVTKVGDNRYSFVMPAGAVKVAVTTEKADYDTRVVLQIGNKNVVIDDRTFANDVTPVIVDNRTMVPIRVITEALGGNADWNEANRTVTLTIDGKVLRMTIDQIIPGFDAAPVIINSRTYVPIRYVAEALGANVEWIAETQQIIIEK